MTSSSASRSSISASPRSLASPASSSNAGSPSRNEYLRASHQGLLVFAARRGNDPANGGGRGAGGGHLRAPAGPPPNLRPPRPAPPGGALPLFAGPPFPPPRASPPLIPP